MPIPAILGGAIAAKGAFDLFSGFGQRKKAKRAARRAYALRKEQLPILQREQYRSLVRRGESLQQRGIGGDLPTQELAFQRQKDLLAQKEFMEGLRQMRDAISEQFGTAATIQSFLDPISNFAMFLALQGAGGGATPSSTPPSGGTAGSGTFIGPLD